MRLKFTEEQRLAFQERSTEAKAVLQNAYRRFIRVHVGVPLNEKGYEVTKEFLDLFYKYFTEGDPLQFSELDANGTKLYVLHDQDRKVEDFFPQD